VVGRERRRGAERKAGREQFVRKGTKRGVLILGMKL
jgi:hypothetical protein